MRGSENKVAEFTRILRAELLPNVKPKPRWFQISLRSLFVVMLLCAIGFGWLRNERDKVRRRLAVIDAVENSGAQIEFGRAYSTWTCAPFGDTSPGEVQGIFFFNSQIIDFDVALFAKLTRLRFLNVSGIRLTDEDLIHIAHLSRLESLQLRGSGVTDDCLNHLDQLTSLKRLALWDTKVTNEGARNLKEKLPGVRITFLTTRIQQHSNLDFQEFQP